MAQNILYQSCYVICQIAFHDFSGHLNNISFVASTISLYHYQKDEWTLPGNLNNKMLFASEIKCVPLYSITFSLLLLLYSPASLDFNETKQIELGCFLPLCDRRLTARVLLQVVAMLGGGVTPVDDPDRKCLKCGDQCPGFAPHFWRLVPLLWQTSLF
jgi:hypothetical protein